MSGPLGSSQWMYSSGGFYPTEIDQSLMFDGTSYLSRTFGSGNRKTYTFSSWVKRSSLTGAQVLLCPADGSTFGDIRFNSASSIQANPRVGSTNYFLVTSQVFRDISAWYHITWAIDTTQATAANRVKLYVNGVQVTAFSTEEYPPLNADTNLNNAIVHGIGRFWESGFESPFNGYLADTYFIDGTALDPTSFGEFKNGVWIPKAYTGSYGTNGFHLTYQDDTVSEGFNTVTYTGNGATQSISGIGFSPDLVWIKQRSGATSHWLNDAVRGAGLSLASNTNEEEKSYAAYFTSFNNDGFSLAGGTGGFNATSGTYVGWCWDAGDSTVSNTDGSITSSVRANPAYGFSIVSYTGTGANATVGHGLNLAPKMVIIKKRNVATSWMVYTEPTGNGSWLYLDLNNSKVSPDDISYWNSTTPSSTVISLGTYHRNNSSSEPYIAYCFSEIAGYSKIGSYTGNGSASGPTVTLGFKPAFVMIKRTDVANSWVMYDSTRQTTNPKDLRVLADSSDAEFDGNEYITFTDTGFEIQYSGDLTNASGGTYIYMAFADTRDLAFWRDQSGNGNDWQPTNLNYQDTVFDSPTNNYATLNPLYFRALRPTLSDGNLKLSTSSANDSYFAATIGTGASGKYYFEMTYVSAVNGLLVGAIDNPTTGNGNGGTYRNNGELSNFDGSTAATGATYTAGDIVGVAINVDAGELKFYKNNSLQGTVSFTAGTEVFPWGRTNGTGSETATFNFGQSGFTYTPPTDFLALSTANLPEPSISPLYGASPQDHFNTVLYTGNGSTQSITGVGFQPDWVWIKARSFVENHALYDSVRGATKDLRSDVTNAENTNATGLTAFGSDGFSIGSVAYVNQNAATYAAWNWKASNATAVSNTAGTITSQVSANPTAGFSIVTYTGNVTAGATVGHGLGAIPKMIIVKSRDNATPWVVYHSGNTSAPETEYLRLNETSATADFTTWNDTAPTSSVFSLGTTTWVNATSSMLAYCFADVEGYSKFGSYTGNGSTDGPFVYTGFRPAWVMYKCSSASGDGWSIWDVDRDPINGMDRELIASSYAAEGTATDYIDFVSNGFKIRASGGSINLSGGTFIYMAFAENPFKYSVAR
jgi:hypothetical protein